jgi:hypothetical protein
MVKRRSELLSSSFFPPLGAPILEWVSKGVPGIFMDCHMMVAAPEKVRASPFRGGRAKPKEGGGEGKEPSSEGSPTESKQPSFSLHDDIDFLYWPSCLVCIAVGLGYCQSRRISVHFPLRSNQFVPSLSRQLFSLETLVFLHSNWPPDCFCFEEDPLALIAQIKAAGMKAGMAISPDTPSSAVTDEIAEAADMILVMTVYPGESTF